MSQFECRLKGHTSDIYNIAWSSTRGLFYTNSNDMKAIAFDPFNKKMVMTYEHSAGVYAKCLSYDHKYLITCTAEKQMVYWDLDTHQPLYSNESDEIVIKSILATEDGKYLITGDNANRVHVRQYTNNPGNNPILFVIRKHKKTVWSLAVNSTSTILFSGDEDGMIFVTDLTNARELAHLRGHEKKVKIMAVTRDDSVMISGSWDLKIKL